MKLCVAFYALASQIQKLRKSSRPVGQVKMPAVLSGFPINCLCFVKFLLKIVSMARIIFIAVLLSIVSPTNAAEKNGLFRLVYVFSDHCVFCKAWERDVGSLYGDTQYAKKAPLFKMEISLFREHFADLTPNVSVTPTFILTSGNDEVGRIVGYQNRDMFFWALSEYIPD